MVSFTIIGENLYLLRDRLCLLGVKIVSNLICINTNISNLIWYLVVKSTLFVDY
jgi:hypothetical protein